MTYTKFLKQAKKLPQIHVDRPFKFKNVISKFNNTMVEVTATLLIISFMTILASLIFLATISAAIYFFLSLPDRVKRDRIRKLNKKYLRKRLSYLP
ncbi:hypothetical protein JCM12825_01010 [Desulfurobacterium crinifex]